MAVTYFGVGVGGQGPADVTIDTSTTSSDVELAVDDTNLAAGNVNAKDKIATALEAIRQSMEEYGY